MCPFGCVSVCIEYPCVHGRCFCCCCCSGCRFLSVVSRPKVSSSTVTFSPSQDLLCLTTMVWGSSSADDTRPSSVGCMWAGRRVTGPGWEMAANTGVMEPKGHEESHRDGENSGRVMEDVQRRGQLLWVAFCISLSCSLALSFCVSLLLTWVCLPLPHLLLFSHFLSFSLSVLLALLLCWLRAMLSVPLSHPVMEGWPVEWRGDEAMEAFNTGKHTPFPLLPSFVDPKHVPN